ncbi:LysR family transcriptional regulator [Caulobacter segnis]
MARRQLPSLNALRAFEAFGRHGRMTLAADELCVTHGAVSRQICQLEEHLGVTLTEGRGSRLRMTEAGLKLAQALSPAFDQIEAAVPRPVQVGPRPLVVSCLPTFAMKWLIPRLSNFQAAHPDIPVRVAESNGPFDFKDDEDRPGHPHAPRGRVGLCGTRSPRRSCATSMGRSSALELAAAGPATFDRICGLPRLLTRTYAQGWSDWVQDGGYGDLPPAVSEQEFDHYFYMLEAAAAGLGVAVGPWAFVQQRPGQRKAGGSLLGFAPRTDP